MHYINVLNIKIADTTEDELLNKLQYGILYTPNFDHLFKLQRDRELYESYERANWVICDSRILYFVLKFISKGIKCSISGSDFLRQYYLYHKDDANCRIFLLGGIGDVANKAKERINSFVGRNMVVGAYSPSIGFETNQTENETIISMIKESCANVVVVGVGCPKQEIWINKYHHRAPTVNVWMALGATIDFEAGKFKRAPRWIRRIAMEWLYRFILEPRRLFKRYFLDDIRVFWYLGKQYLGLYNNPLGH